MAINPGVYVTPPLSGISFNHTNNVVLTDRDGNEYNLDDIVKWSHGDLSSLGLDRRMEWAIRALSTLVVEWTK